MTPEQREREIQVHTHTRLVWSIVRRYVGCGVEREDLFQLGCIGLLKAIDGFDPSYGTRFSTYAVPKIAGEIRRFLRDDGAIKVGRPLRERQWILRRTEDALTKTLGRPPTLGELSAELGESPEELAVIIESGTSVLSFQSVLPGGGSLEECLRAPDREEDTLERLDLWDAVARLESRDRLLIRLRFGHDLSQSRTAKVLGISQAQVSRLEKRILTELREKMTQE